MLKGCTCGQSSNVSLAVIGLTGLLAVPAGAAWAEDPVALDPVTKIVDKAGVLGGDKAEVESAIKKLGTDHAMTLHVVYVKTFTNPDVPSEWAAEVATNANLGQNALVLAVATDSRKYQLSKPGNSKITNAQRDKILSSAVDPQLRAGDWAQAAVDAAAAVGDAAGGGSGTVPAENGAGTAVLVGTGVVAAGGAGAYLYFRNRRKKAAQASSASYGPQGAELDPLASLSVEELRRKSGSLLIEADDAIKSSEQELMFAQAQYGDSAVGNFTKALQEAKAHMSESFKLQQQLDDHIPGY